MSSRATGLHFKAFRHSRLSSNGGSIHPYRQERNATHISLHSKLKRPRKAVRNEDLPSSQLDRDSRFQNGNSAPARLLRKPPQLLEILAQAQQVRLVVGTLHEAHLVCQEVALVGPLGVQALPIVEFPGAVLVLALSVVLVG